MKFAHGQRIASTTIKFISKKNLLSISSISVKTIQRIIADPKRKLSPPFDSADSVPSLGHPAPGSGQNAVSIYCALRLPSLGDRDRKLGTFEEFLEVYQLSLLGVSTNPLSRVS